MLRCIFSKESDTNIIYVWRVSCRETGCFWHHINLLNKNLEIIKSQVVISQERRFTTLTDTNAIFLANQMLHGQD